MTYRQLHAVNLMLGAAALAFAAAACGGSSPVVVRGSGGTTGDGSGGSGGSGSGGSGSGGSGNGGADAGAAPEVGNSDAVGPNPCHVVVEKRADEGAQHLEQCAPTSYISSPPSSGNHYPTWPAYKIYDKPVPWGFLVHGLEHGAVVISYRCDSGCPEELAKAKAFVNGLAPDVFCASSKLVALVPDPKLDVAFAASAWTWTLRADCFDATAFGQFITDHYAQGLERVCSQGADLSASNWCPATQ